jgi:nuclear autoantigenic sperm protein
MAHLISEDIDNSLSDYKKALAMVEQLVEPDHRRIVELYPLYGSYTILCAILSYKSDLQQFYWSHFMGTL